MKKISLALIAGLLANPVLGNETPKTPEAISTVAPAAATSKFSGWNATLGGSYMAHFGETLPDNHVGLGGKAYLGFGYTSVAENNFLFGASIFAGVHRVPESIGEVNIGLKLNAGMVVADNIAIKGIAEINAYTALLSVSALTSFVNVGVGVDYAVTDHIILGAGVKYNAWPLPMFSEHGVEAFAEISYRF